MTTSPQPESELTETQKAYNVAQSEVFQLAAYGHHRYHSSGEALTDEGRRQQRDYNDRIQKAREQLEAALLRLVAEHAETFRGDWGVVAAWLRSLAEDPAMLSLLAVRPDERDFDTAPASAPSAPADRAELREQIAAVIHEDLTQHKVRRDLGLLGIVPRLADAVLAVLPMPTDRAAVLREAIDVAREEGHRLEGTAGIEPARGARSVAYLLRRLLAKERPAQQPMPHGERRDRFARVIYERWNPGHQWANAHPDDVTAYGADADHAMAAADSVAGIPYALPTRTDIYREVADRLTALGTRPDCGWATTAAGKVRAWADDERDEQEAQAHLDQLADELPELPPGFRSAVVIAVKCAVCGYAFDEDESYTVHFDTIAQAHQVLQDHGWTVLADGRAVCDSDKDDHHELRGTTSPAKAREDSDREHHQAEINAAINYALNEMP